MLEFRPQFFPLEVPDCELQLLPWVSLVCAVLLDDQLPFLRV